MKLSEYSKIISKLAKKYPNADVIYSSDEEGNSFSEVTFDPSVGNFKYDEFHADEEPINSICIN